MFAFNLTGLIYYVCYRFFAVWSSHPWLFVILLLCQYYTHRYVVYDIPSIPDVKKRNFLKVHNYAVNY